MSNLRRMWALGLFRYRDQASRDKGAGKGETSNTQYGRKTGIAKAIN